MTIYIPTRKITAIFTEHNALFKTFGYYDRGQYLLKIEEISN